jgi:cytochrome c-type biogenesis protein CcmE
MLGAGFGHWGTEASVMAPISSLRVLGTGIIPWLFPEGRGIGLVRQMISMVMVASIMAPISSLRDLGMGIVPQLFPEGRGIGLVRQMVTMQWSFSTFA